MIHYVKGDASDPTIYPGDNYIIHVVNNKKAWGRGFVLCLSKKWPHLEQQFLKRKPELGTIFINKVETNLYVVDMYAQKGLISKTNLQPFSYELIDSCLRVLQSAISTINTFNKNKITIHCPKFGTGLGGANWSEIVPYIEKYLNDFEVYIYTLSK